MVRREILRRASGASSKHRISLGFPQVLEPSKDFCRKVQFAVDGNPALGLAISIDGNQAAEETERIR